MGPLIVAAFFVGVLIGAVGGIAVLALHITLRTERREFSEYLAKKRQTHSTDAALLDVIANAIGGANELDVAEALLRTQADKLAAARRQFDRIGNIAGETRQGPAAYDPESTAEGS